MMEARIVVSREARPELFGLTISVNDGHKWHDRKLNLSVHELIPALNAVQLEPEIIETFYRLPLGSSVQWHTPLSESQLRELCGGAVCDR